MPSAIDVRLSALRLSGVDIGAFSPGRREYAGVAREATTTVAATPAAAGARATITPADADPASGHQVAVAPGVEIAVTVDSADGSRTGVYRVRLLQGNRPPTLRALSLVELRVGGPAAAIALTELAADPDGDTLSYEVSMSTHPAVATVREHDGMLIVSPVSPGRALFTVSASDGQAASEPITVSVEVAAADAPTAIRIAAQRADDGRIEFALQLRSAAGDWGPRLAPRVRFLPPAEAERWLVSSPLAVLVDAERERTAEVRIAARWRSGGHVEFALQVRGANGDWGERILPRLRFLAPGQGVARWLSSSPTDIAALSPALDEVAELRVGARRLADGRVEVALITVDPFGAAAERRLPAARHLPAAPPPDRWFNSGVLTVLADASTGAAVDVRISLRQRTDGRTEMALQIRDNGVWQDRSLPTSRYLPPTADIDHWLTSSPIPIPAAN